MIAPSPVSRVLMGAPKPRISPPVPARHDAAGFRQVSTDMGIELMPWQDYAARFLTATGPDERLLYREVAVVVARQQGKTTLMKPHIIRALRAGKRIMHIAQNRELPRHMFGVVADAIAETDEDLLPRRRGKIIWPRYGSGQEEIVLTNGGQYRIAASSRGGARGFTNDIVIIDELREMDNFDVLASAEPTLTMSPDPQMIYLSNAGSDASVVLNSVRKRAGEDPSLAYLEWSADPERAADDQDGWAEANPAIGHFPGALDSVERSYTSNKLAGTMANFETERLCRWVVTMRERLVDEPSWALGHRDELVMPRRVSMAVSMDPGGRMAAAAVAWLIPDGTVGLRLLEIGVGDPVDPDAFGEAMAKRARRVGSLEVAYDPLTDRELAKHFKKAKAIGGAEWTNASVHFVNLVRAGRLLWDDAEQVTDDLMWTSRKDQNSPGTYQAVRANDDRPIPAALASIRAVWLASGPRVTSRPRVY